MLAACGGFLLGVLWMDLLVDLQALDTPTAAGLASIASYYRRVTIDASPFHLLIGAVMLLTLAGAAYRVASSRAGSGRGWRVLAVLLVAVPIGLALARVLPNAVRLGSGADPPATQAVLAHAICLDHLLCFALMLAFVVLMLASARAARCGA
jgi:hypothetical protein